MAAAPIRRSLACSAAVLLLATGIHAQSGLTKPQPGQGGSTVKGAVGTSGGIGDDGLQHCDRPMGALAVLEPQNTVMVSLRRYNLSSPAGLIRLMVQQSNCFIVVERGAGMGSMMQERQLAGAGQLRDNSNVGGGQMVAADFVMTPSVVFSENNAGGAGAGVAKALGKRNPTLAAVAGGLKFKEAQTSMLVTDSRSGVQVAAAEGSTRKADLKLGGAFAGGATGVALGAYGNTNEGKIIAAAFMDNYNNIVRVVRDDPSLQRNVGTLKEEAAAGGAKRAGEAFDVGAVVVPKIANVKILDQPNDTAKAVATLGRSDELVVVGAEKDGYVNVQGAAASGWVKAVLLTKR